MMKSVARIKDISVTPLKAKLSQPFRTALGEHRVLENVLLSLTLEDGTRGYGEAAIATHITGETVAETMKNLQRVGTRFIGRDARDYLKLSAETHEALPRNKAAVAAVEMAVLDALTRQWKIPLWKFFGDKPRPLTTDITIVIADLEETRATARKFFKQGCRAFKIKIGRDPDLDYQRVLTVARIVKRGDIYLDANQGYSAEETLRFLKKLKSAGVVPALVEQPVPKHDWDGLKKVTRLGGVPVCADESVGSLPQAVRAIQEKAAHVINIKVMKCGLMEAREIALRARAAGVKLMIGGMMETSLAMTAAAHLASGLGGFDFIDLDTPFFIKEDQASRPYLSSRGVYDLRPVKAGIGVIP